MRGDTVIKLYVGGAFALVGCFLVLCFYGASRWATYAREHHCQEVRRESEVTYQWMYDDKGIPSYMYPVYYDRITYRCDGGEEVVR